MLPASKQVDPLLIDTEGHTECLLGNEAIVRGALEAGVVFAAGYPGTPSSEITDSFARIARHSGRVIFEYSVNEKIAIEMAFAASLAGARSICAMKHLGLMSGGDPISTIPYIGVEAGMVIVSAADPSCRTSPNEQDQRYLGPMLHIPILDPSTPQQALELTRLAFEISERSRLPVLLRVTTRVCHSQAPVVYGPLAEVRVGGFSRNPARYVPVPHNARRMRQEIPGRLEIAREVMEQSSHLTLERRGHGSAVILASGAPAGTCRDVLEHIGALKNDVTLWNLAAVHPLPESELLKAFGAVSRLLVVEELSSYLEDRLGQLFAKNGLTLEILGKHSGHFPVEFEYTPAIIQRGIYEAFGIGTNPAAGPSPFPGAEPSPRPPTLCAGCGHRSAFFAARAAFDEEQLYFNDIGCYSLGYGPPLDAADALLCMGAGFTLAAGVSRVTGQRTVGFVGDSTFYHSGIPALLNAAKESVNMVAVILDNEVTAMTGFQESAGHTASHHPPIEGMVRALGIEQVETVDAYELSACVQAFERARDAQGLSVVVVVRACPAHQARITGRPHGEALTIDHSRCRTCGRESSELRCEQCVSVPFERGLVAARASSGCAAPGPVMDIAACSVACPLSLCVQGYVVQIAAGQYQEALEHVLARTPLPESVCRVCHRPCEVACVRGDIDDPIAINDLKRFVVDWSAKQADAPARAAVAPPSGKRVAIVGAGPAGLSAAHELAMRGHKVTLYDQHTRPGGMLAWGIPRYRLPESVLERDVARILALDVTFVGETALGRDIQLKGLLDDSDMVYLAIGAQKGQTLALEGADALPRQNALSYLLAVQDGEAAAHDGAVVVIGGGNAAIDAARTARRRGAACVTVVCVESREQMPALPEEVAAALEEGIILHAGYAVDGFAAGAICCSEIDGAAQISVATDEMIVAIGQRPDLSCLAGPADDSLPPGGRADQSRAGEGLALVRDGDCLRVDAVTARTSHPRIYAGGDVVSAGERTVTGAMAAGLRAAWAIDRKLRGPELADERPPPKRLVAERWEKTLQPTLRPRATPPERLAAARATDFDEVVGVMSSSVARAEARRCLGCGMCGNCRACIDLSGCPAFMEIDGNVEIDAALCNGCGVCVSFCPNGAIVPRSEA